MLFDQAIREVREPGSSGAAALLLPEGRAALKAYLAGGRVVFQVERASDIRQVVRFAKARGMKPVIAGGSEAWVVARELAEAGVPVILDPLVNLPSDFDRLGARFDNAKLLHEAGVRIAFSQPNSFHQRKNRQHAGNAVAHGLPWDAALAAITSAPAEIFGLSAARGRIEPGQAADLVLWSGDPLEVTTVAEQVWIAGNPVAMRSRQSELRDRYLERLRSGATD
jgi:imidazolonepropionase-like amidohydrolase